MRPVGGEDGMKDLCSPRTILVAKSRYFVITALWLYELFVILAPGNQLPALGATWLAQLGA